MMMEDDKLSEDEWDRLTPAARAERCRRLADQARNDASRYPKQSAQFLRLAQGWESLARRTEQDAPEAKD